ncbi:MAG: cohesin domain-containing protein [Candidatus Bathyarchaeia archaeon]
MVMLYRGAFSRVAYLTVCIFFLLGITLIGLFVSATGSTPTTQPTPTISSVPMTTVTPATESTPVTQSTRTTSPVSTTQSTPDIAMPDATNETTFIVLPQEVDVNVGDTFFVSVFAENVRNMYGWQVILFFDPIIVECLNVSVPGQQVFSDRYPVSQALIDFNSTEFTKRPLQSVQNGKGFVLTGDCLLGRNQTTFYGSGFLCQVTFKALSSGSSNLALSTADVQPFRTYYLDEGLDLIIPSLSNSSITVLTK